MKLLSQEKKNAANRISAIEAGSSDLVKVKNDAITKLNKDL
jgi:hypothetical protein